MLVILHIPEGVFSPLGGVGGSARLAGSTACCPGLVAKKEQDYRKDFRTKSPLPTGQTISTEDTYFSVENTSEGMAAF